MPGSSDHGSSSNGGNPPGFSPNGGGGDENTATAAAAAASLHPDNSSVPKPKRLACMICRKRKLKCDGVRPSCSTCSRLGHDCAYDEQRRKSGPKRGYVKALEERLKQVETMLKTQEPTTSSRSASNGMAMPMPGGGGGPNHQTNGVPAMPVSNSAMGINGEERWNFGSGESPQAGTLDDFGGFNTNSNMGMSINNNSSSSSNNNNNNNMGGNFTWEMIGLGLEEPLPPQETIDELHQIYFDKIHPSTPMIHRYRYLAAMNLAPSQRPPVCLRYAMWTLACSISDKYSDLKDLFYQRTRKYVEADYVRGYGEHMISVAHCQTHVLLACYEMKMMYFPRAWMSTGSAVRLAQMMGLHRLDGAGLDVKQCLLPPKDWTEREERRRTFWMAFCEDRYASIGTGWPMTIDERDVMTTLPASEEAFELSRPELTQTLEESTSPSGAANLSPFGGVILLASLFGRNLIHLHRPDDEDLDHDINGPFWKRHRQLDNIILNTSLSLPSHLKLPAGLGNPNIVFTNMSIHTSTICLHQAAIFKAEKNKLSTSVSSESKIRCLTAANEIASIMRTISHMDLSAMNPFLAFCLYVSARVFVQYLKDRPDDAQAIDSLRFLISAMNALKRRNALTESFLVQLDVDFESLAISIPRLRNAFPRLGDSPGSNGRVGPVCDDPDGVRGIMSYRNDCRFKTNGDDGNAATASDVTDLQGDSQNTGTSRSNGYGSQVWLSAEQQMVVLTPNSGSLYEKNGLGSGALSGGFGDGNGDGQDALGSPDARDSAGRTPNSSGGGSDARSYLAPGQMGTGASGRESYRASPVSPQQNLMNPNAGSVDVGNHQGFYGDPGGFTMGTGMGDPQGGYGMSNGWGGLNGQPVGMQPMGEGVLRALLNMGPMDAMDLSSWDSGNAQ